jgi:hypothetical protein
VSYILLLKVFEILPPIFLWLPILLPTLFLMPTHSASPEKNTTIFQNQF